MQLLRGTAIHFLAVDEAAAIGKPPHEDIFGDCQIRQKPHFLVDQDDAGINRFAWPIRSIGFSLPLHGA
jgi:hypothetical protein